MSELVACTTTTKNYLSHVRLLTSTFLKCHPGSKVFVLLADETDGYFDPDQESFSLVSIKDLGIGDIQRLEFKYDQLELCTALKPFLLEYLFKTYGFRKIIYLDNDIMVMDDFGDVSELLDRYSIVLTPHLLEPIGDIGKPSELDILIAGTYNLGFLAIAATKNSVSFLEWWKSRLHDYCVMDPSKGLYGDQKWVELALGYFEGIHILRDPGYNVAYWNLGARRLEVNQGKYFVNGKPLRFFHFSRFDPNYPQIISKYQDRYRPSDLPECEALLSAYRNQLISFGYETTRHWPWAFDCFENGAKVTNRMRRIYRESQELQRNYPNPFLTSSQDCYYRWAKGATRRELLNMFTRGFKFFEREGLRYLIQTRHNGESDS